MPIAVHSTIEAEDDSVRFLIRPSLSSIQISFFRSFLCDRNRFAYQAYLSATGRLWDEIGLIYGKITVTLRYQGVG